MLLLVKHTDMVYTNTLLVSGKIYIYILLSAMSNTALGQLLSSCLTKLTMTAFSSSILHNKISILCPCVIMKVSTSLLSDLLRYIARPQSIPLNHTISHT